eukprot:TRINITY_DN21501_c0_g1_i1.p1 TRINITY_DN21501_c0_g1~~TRINITY_DN21501_c0_g1_i1.p1  ORF type:complete len:258 (+),score=44.15 TRINITY_DN21501_c0_g1_i1:54-827(+)
MSNTTTTSPVNSATIALNFYIIGLLSTGASFRLLVKRRMTSVSLFILPMAALLSALVYVIIGLNALAVGSTLTEDELLRLAVVQLLADVVSVFTLESAYFVLLRILITHDTRYTRQPYLRHFLLLFLVIPFLYCTNDIVGIAALYHPALETTTNFLFGVGNILIAFNDICMRSTFIYYILNLPSLKLAHTRVAVLKLVGILSFDVLMLVVGGVVFLFDSTSGGGIIYGAWLINICVCLQLNEVISKALHGKVRGTEN